MRLAAEKSQQHEDKTKRGKLNIFIIQNCLLDPSCSQDFLVWPEVFTIIIIDVIIEGSSFDWFKHSLYINSGMKVDPKIKHYFSNKLIISFDKFCYFNTIFKGSYSYSLKICFVFKVPTKG